MIVSALNPRFRDTGIIWTVTATALFYATPVLYPIEIVPETLGRHPGAEPAGAAVRAGAQVGDRPGRARPGRGRGRRGVAADPGRRSSCSMCALAVWIFKREAPRIAEEL